MSTSVISDSVEVPIHPPLRPFIPGPPSLKGRFCHADNPTGEPVLVNTSM